jgi:hypothetical protein
MSINHPDDSDGRDRRPVKASVLLSRDRNVRRFEDEPVWMLEIERDLTRSIAFELMTAPRKPP